MCNEKIKGCPNFRFYSKDYDRYFDVIEINFKHNIFQIKADNTHYVWIDGLDQLESVTPELSGGHNDR